VKDRAKALGVEAIFLSHKDFPSRVVFDLALSKILQDSHIELVILAGWMRLLSPEFLRIHTDVLNIHPSLLPAFPGLGAIEQAYEAQVEETGCTVHVVVPAMDSGPIIAQAFVKTAGLNLEELENRIHEAEHILYPRSIADFVDKMKISAKKTE
jgi:phosphoribosylglycinamide formyltransferase-1